MTVDASHSRRTVARTVDRVEDKRRLGPDAQVDDKALVIMPTDPARTDPFLAMSEDWFSSPGFQWHPHRGLETVTTVLDGVLEHGDNLGNVGALQAGDVQWMTAGRGIIHRELAYRDEHVHTLQLWLNLPACDKMVDTRYQDLLATVRPRITAPGAVIEVISGTVNGVAGPALNHWPVTAALITLEPGAVLTYRLPAADRAFAYVLTGATTVAGRPVRAGQTAWSDPVPGPAPVSDLLLGVPDRDQVTTVMIYSGRPIGDPVVFGGSFVMNHPDEIVQAYRDVELGRFGQVPRQARLAAR